MRLDPDTLPFDRFERIQRLAATIERLDPLGSQRVLDVGGYPGLLADALPEREVWTLDRVECARARYVQASGADMPFGDGDFDCVVASDTLEHVPPPERDAFVSECARVAKRALIVSGPFDTPGVAWVERKTSDWHMRLRGRSNAWLAEHVAYGPPSLVGLCECLESKGADVRVYPHGDLVAWFLLLFADMAIGALPNAAPATAALSRAFNRHWAPRDSCGDIRAATYRHVVVARFAGPPAPSDLVWPQPPIDPRHPLDGGVEARLQALSEGLDIVVASLAAQSAAATDESALPPAAAAYIATLEAALRENESRPQPKHGWLGRLKRLLTSNDSGLGQ